MGQEDHEETPDSPRTLDPGLDSGPDLVYLHLTGPNCALYMEEDLGPGATRGETDEEEHSSNEEERDNASSVPENGESERVVEKRVDGAETGPNPVKPVHQPLCRTQCVDLGSDGPPDLAPHQEDQPHSPAKSSSDVRKEYQAKLEFALKLGYSEDLVRSVLEKLGPDTLINDVLMELVRLGTKAELDLGPEAGSSSAATPSCGCADELRAESPTLAESLSDQDNLRPIVVDGSNVAMSHGNKEVFSCQGIQLAVDWFLERGHHDITVFVPAWRKEQSRPDAPITDQEILRRLEKQKVLVFTPSRRVQGRRVVCYDDRFIVKLAFESDGIIVSNDNYRDLANERPEWKRFIDERLLMYSFVNDKFMPPDDPLGRHGPSLDNFLRKRPMIPEQKKQPCPYGKKCTYGHKCKYYHPERGAQPQRAVADELRASAKTQTKVQPKTQADPGLVKSHSVPTAEAQRKASGSKRQSDPSVRALSYGDAEERLLLKHLSGTKSGLHKCMSPAPGGPPSVAPSQSQDELSRSGTPHGHASDPPYPLCHSPEYYCVSRAFSNLSLTSSRPGPDLRPAQDQDYRLSSLGSAGSECGSESSSCDSCPPDSLMDDFHYSRFYAPHEYDYPPHASHPEAPPKRPAPLYAPLPQHLQHPPLSARSSCPGDYHHHHHHHHHHQAPPPLTRTLADSASDSRLYEHFSRPHPPHASHQRPKVLPHWDTYYRPPLPSTRYDAAPCYWDSYGSPTHYLPPSQPYAPPTHPDSPYASPLHLDSHYPPHPDSLYAPSPQKDSPYAPPPHPDSPYAPPTFPESPARARYSDLRDKVYLNLCNIFPAELVAKVMSRSPHVTDPQQLAAAILAEKAQSGGF